MREFHGNSIAYNLLKVGFITDESPVWREGLQKRTLTGGQWTNGGGVCRIVGMALITLGDRAIDTANGGARLVNGEDSTSGVTSWMAVVEVDWPSIAKCLANSQRTLRERLLVEGDKRIVCTAKNAYDNGAFALLRKIYA